MRRMSKKRAMKARAFKKVRAAAFVRDGHECQFWAMVRAASRDGRLLDTEHVTADARCFGPLDPHHVSPQGRGGADDESNLISLCRYHHGWTEEHPLIARAVGLTKATEAPTQ